MGAGPKTVECLGVFWDGEEVDGLTAYGLWSGSTAPSVAPVLAERPGAEIKQSKLAGPDWTVWVWDLRFRRTWKSHHPLDDSQLAYAGQSAKVSNVSFYHGGDELYQLEGIPGIWHEACLQHGS